LKGDAIVNVKDILKINNKKLARNLNLSFDSAASAQEKEQVKAEEIILRPIDLECFPHFLRGAGPPKAHPKLPPQNTAWICA
jgi:hypothetical protein